MPSGELSARPFHIIYKYPILLQEGIDFTRTELNIMLPKGAKILKFDFQGKIPTLWAMIDPSKAPERRRFNLKFTGQEVNPDYIYIGTAFSEGLVFHLFEVI